MTSLLRLSMVGLALAAPLTGCSLFSSPGDSAASGSPNEVTVIEDPAHFDRRDVEIDPIEIGAAAIDGDLLVLQVSYAGGCEDHTVRLYSTRGLYESLPPQADAYLSHDANGDTCEALIQEEVSFDLTPLQEDYDALLLRLHPYRQDEPIRPLLRYEY